MWTTISQCICGVSHELSGKPCEDCIAIKTIGERLLIAVCDGVGSAANGGLGAKHVAKSLIYSAQRFLPATIGLADWRERISHCFQLCAGVLSNVPTAAIFRSTAWPPRRSSHWQRLVS